MTRLEPEEEKDERKAGDECVKKQITAQDETSKLVALPSLFGPFQNTSWLQC